jgi:hypothetical protein
VQHLIVDVSYRGTRFRCAPDVLRPIDEWTPSFPSKITPLYETKDTFDIESAQLIVRSFRIGPLPLLGGGAQECARVWPLRGVSAARRKDSADEESGSPSEAAKDGLLRRRKVTA